MLALIVSASLLYNGLPLLLELSECFRGGIVMFVVSPNALTRPPSVGEIGSPEIVSAAPAVKRILEPGSRVKD